MLPNITHWFLPIRLLNTSPTIYSDTPLMHLFTASLPVCCCSFRNRPPAASFTSLKSLPHPVARAPSVKPGSALSVTCRIKPELPVRPLLVTLSPLCSLSTRNGFPEHPVLFHIRRPLLMIFSLPECLLSPSARFRHFMQCITVTRSLHVCPFPVEP